MPPETPEADRLASLSDAELIEEASRCRTGLNRRLVSAGHHQRQAAAFLAHGDFAAGHAHAAAALSAAVIGALEHMADEDDERAGTS